MKIPILLPGSKQRLLIQNLFMPYQFEQNFITDEVIEFLEDYDVFRNPNGVEISYDSNGSVMIAVNWSRIVHDPEFDIETFVYAMPFKEFIRTFKVQTISDLQQIQPGILYHLYEIRKAEVGCIVVRPLDCYCIQYRKRNNLLMATDDEDVKHIVYADLQTFDDFKRYSFEYFGFKQ